MGRSILPEAPATDSLTESSSGTSLLSASFMKESVRLQKGSKYDMMSSLVTEVP